MSDHFSPHPLPAHEQPSDSGAATITGDGQPGESRPLRRTETALQSLSPGYFPFVMASTLVPVWPSQSGLLAPVAVGLWSVGLVLYLLLVTLILLRWLTVPVTPQTLGPPYWILMGATAIIVLAGARILQLPAALAVVKASAGFVEGFSFTLWAFGTWWIPLLVVLGFWRYIRRHWPLGMYSVATLTFGKVARIAFMAPLSRFMLWVALAAWLAVAAAFVVWLWRAAR
jgi:tellurite resistance protein TehA-like permease